MLRAHITAAVRIDELAFEVLTFALDKSLLNLLLSDEDTLALMRLVPHLSDELITEALFRASLPVKRCVMAHHRSNNPRLVGDDILLHYCRLGALDEVRWFIEEVNVMKPFAIDTCYVAACVGGHMDVIHYLHQRTLLFGSGYLLTYQGLRAASFAGRNDIVQWMVTNEKISATAIEDSGALEYASRSGSLPVVQFLVKRLARERSTKELRRGLAANYAINWACRYGHLSVVRWLAKRFGTAVTSKLSAKSLQSACAYGRLALVQWLVHNKLLTAAHLAAPICATDLANCFAVEQWLSAHFDTAVTFIWKC